MSSPLELVVTRSVVGELETNIEQLEKYVDERLEYYKPELYAGDAAAAKKDRAEKRAMIADIWKLKNFGLVSLDKVFNPKWLNKSKKITEISEEMDSIIERIYSDLKTIEKFSDDKETLKAHYLISLSISDTLDYGEELQKKRELAQKEAAGRADREHAQQIKRQEKEVAREEVALSRDASLAADALDAGPQKAEMKEYVVSVRATEEQLLRLKSACNSIGIEYSVEELVF